MMQSVQVIIERLKTHPEDFFGDLNDGRPQPVKFGELASKLDDLLTVKRDGEIHRLWYLNEDEKAALLEAYKETRRARFEAKIFHQLLSSQEVQEVRTVTQRYHPHTGKPLMTGWTDPRAMGAQVQIIKDEEKVYAKNRNPRP